MTLYLAHSAVLVVLSTVTARRLVASWLDRALTVLLLLWGNIVATSLLLSSCNRLGDPVWFFRASLLVAATMWIAMRRLAPARESPDGERPSPRLLLASAATLLPLIWITVRIAATYPPNNFDALTYHLPRAMYYLGQGNLAHFDTGNPRQIYFPLNYNLLQLFTLIYGPPLQALTFINVLAWLASGIAVYRISRLAGLGANASLGSAWFALTATQTLGQASSTTNDLPTGAALLVALVFFLQWCDQRQTRHAILAGLAAGLGAGAKLTVVFFAPAAGLIALVAIWRHARSRALPEFARGARPWLISAATAAVFAAPFALINLAAKGEWITKTYDFTLNRPWSLACVWQTSRAYLVQLFLEPLHRFTFDLTVTSQLNAWGVRTFFPHWNDAYAFSELYLFPPDLNEDHVFFGFAGPVTLLAAVLCLVRFRRSPRAIVWCAALGLGWFATYFWLNKWSLYNQRYFVPAMLVLSPCLGAAIESLWCDRERWRDWMRRGIALLAGLALWLAAVYLFHNTSRPYAPLWAGEPPPPAWPALPPLLVQRLAAEPVVNVQSTAGNERIFLLMGQGRHQRFTSFHHTTPEAYNLFSEWGYVRKVAYTNIEQLSSCTVVPFAGKPTAGVEYLGTIGQGQPAQDYYGLPAHPGTKPATDSNRQVLVELHYGPREPHRYANLQIKVAGLNAPDHAQLVVGVDYDDGTSAELARFDSTGESRASVTRGFKRFTFRLRDTATGTLVGTMDMPHLAREESADTETPFDPYKIASDQFITSAPQTRAAVTGLGPLEGPFPQWDLPAIRWAKAPIVRITVPPHSQRSTIDLAFELCAQTRESVGIEVAFNGRTIKQYRWGGAGRWLIQDLHFPAVPGTTNTIEFRSVSLGSEPDWLDYLDRYPDVKAYVQSQGTPLAQGAREHWENFGQKEGRELFRQRRLDALPEDAPLYFMFRNLRVDALRSL